MGLSRHLGGRWLARSHYFCWRFPIERGRDRGLDTAPGIEDTHDFSLARPAGGYERIKHMVDDILVKDAHVPESVQEKLQAL